jgi:hypothetical protein
MKYRILCIFSKGLYGILEIVLIYFKSIKAAQIPCPTSKKLYTEYNSLYIFYIYIIVFLFIHS